VIALHYAHNTFEQQGAPVPQTKSLGVNDGALSLLVNPNLRGITLGWDLLEHRSGWTLCGDRRHCLRYSAHLGSNGRTWSAPQTRDQCRVRFPKKTTCSIKSTRMREPASPAHPPLSPLSRGRPAKGSLRSPLTVASLREWSGHKRHGLSTLQQYRSFSPGTRT